MAWYLRKAFRLGPLLRLNASKSGLGASFGVAGLRVGTEPRGAYIHGGRGGLYYRQSLSPGRRAPRPTTPGDTRAHAIDSTEIDQRTLGSFETENQRT